MVPFLVIFNNITKFKNWLTHLFHQLKPTCPNFQCLSASPLEYPPFSISFRITLRVHSTLLLHTLSVTLSVCCQFLVLFVHSTQGLNTSEDLIKCWWFKLISTSSLSYSSTGFLGSFTFKASSKCVFHLSIWSCSFGVYLQSNKMKMFI